MRIKSALRHKLRTPCERISGAIARTSRRTCARTVKSTSSAFLLCPFFLQISGSLITTFRKNRRLLESQSFLNNECEQCCTYRSARAR